MLNEEYPKHTEMADFYYDESGKLACTLNIDYRSFDIETNQYLHGDEDYTKKEYELIYQEVVKECNKTNGVYSIDYFNGCYTVRTEEEKAQVRYNAMTDEEKAQDFKNKKEIKRIEINNARDKAEQGGFEYLGKVFDSDPVSCQRILGASLAAQNASEYFKITWTCKDNSTIELNATELVGLSKALVSWSNECHQKASELKSQIDNATTKEDLDSISW